MTTLVPPIPGAIPFVDTSSHNEDDQHQIDWPTLAKVLLAVHPEAGAIVKMSQGDWYVNPYRHRQRWGAHSAGLKNVGLYHYVELVSGGGPNQGKGLSGTDNANALLKAIGDDAGIVAGEFLAGDWEDQSAGPTADLDACALGFGNALHWALGIPPLLYSGDWYAKPHDLERDPALAAFPAWWAIYQPPLVVPFPWSQNGYGVSLWQFTTDAALPGLPWACDVSWWLAGLPALRGIQWPPADPLVGPTDPNPDIPTDDKGSATDVPGGLKVVSGHLGSLAGAIGDASLRGQAMVCKSDVDAMLRSFGLLP